MCYRFTAGRRRYTVQFASMIQVTYTLSVIVGVIVTPKCVFVSFSGWSYLALASNAVDCIATSQLVFSFCLHQLSFRWSIDVLLLFLYLVSSETSIVVVYSDNGFPIFS